MSAGSPTVPAGPGTALSPASRRLAGVLLVVYPTVVYGGVSLLTLLLGGDGHADNPLRRELWRAGHAHAGVLLLLSLVVLRYVDEVRLPARARSLVRHSVPAAAILLPAGFFLSVLPPDATAPNALIGLAYVGAALLTVGMLGLGGAAAPSGPDAGRSLLARRRTDGVARTPPPHRIRAASVAGLERAPVYRYVAAAGSRSPGASPTCAGRRVWTPGAGPPAPGGDRARRRTQVRDRSRHWRAVGRGRGARRRDADSGAAA
jgi:hypothetical protein